MTITLAEFRAQANFGGYQVQPCATAVWNEALGELVIVSSGGAGLVPSAFVNAASPNIAANAYTELVASLASGVSQIVPYNGASVPVILAVGGAGSEKDVALLFPGHAGYALPLTIATGARLSLKSTSGTISSGIVGINFIK